MVKLRAAKIEKIADYIPLQTIDTGKENAKLCILGWGSTYGSIKSVSLDLIKEGYDVAHVHLRYLNPFPKNLGELLSGFETILIPEMNNGQLIRLIRDKYLLPAIGLNKIKGLPFTTLEIREKVIELLNK